MRQRLATSVRMVVMAIGACLWGLATQSLPAASQDWLPVRETSLIVPLGSPLDFSALVTVVPAGSQGRVIARPDGALAYEGRPEQSVRFLCASLAWSGASGAYPEDHMADLYAEQLKVHGYNVARFHFVDNNLMSGQARDFDFNQEQLRRLRYLLAALKRNGIGWIIDAQTSENGAYGGVYPHRWISKFDLKVRVQFDPEARKHWLRLVDDILGTVNPYTGLRPLDDPALVAIVAFNENGLQFASILNEFKTGRAYPLVLQGPFNAWLKATYGTTEKLAAAWNGALGRDEDLDKQAVRLPASRRETGPRMRDLQRYFIDSETETFSWMAAELRKRGYKGLASAYNNLPTIATQTTREVLPLVTMNTYFDEVLSLETNASISQASSFDSDVDYIRNVFASRWLGKPLLLTEHDHVFWNQFRHESGVAMSAYAAFQGWSGLCRHAMGPIDLSYRQPNLPHKQRLLPYSIGFDPVARASETLAALLYARGDVAPAKATIAVPFEREAGSIESAHDQLSSDLTRLGLLTGFGLSRSPTPGPGASKGAMPIPGDTSAPSVMDALIRALPHRLATAVDRATGGRDRAFAQRLEQLVRAGHLDPEAARLAEERVYRSDTGEILLDAPRRLMQVTTPRTEAITFDTLASPQTVGKLTVLAADAPAMLAVSALDDEALPESKRILLIFATDALNTDQKFSDASHRTVTDYGRLPVLVRRGKIRLRLALAPANTEAGRPAVLRSLKLDGTPGAVLPVAGADGGLEIDLDNATEHGPTTFFLIER